MAETIAIVSAVAGVVGTGISAIGAYNAAQSQAAAARYQAEVARNNATIAAQNATHATEAGATAATDAGLRGRAAVGAVIAQAAGSGIDVNSGSAADAAVGQREISHLNTERVLDNAALQAYGYRTQQTSFQAQAGLLDAQASQASASALPNALGTLLSGASSVGNNWQKLQNSAGNSGSVADTGSSAWSGISGWDYGYSGADF